MKATRREAEGRGREAPRGAFPRGRGGLSRLWGARAQPRIPPRVTAEGLFAQPADETDHGLDPAQILVNVQALVGRVRRAVGLGDPAYQERGAQRLLEIERNRDRATHSFQSGVPPETVREGRPESLCGGIVDPAGHGWRAAKDVDLDLDAGRGQRLDLLCERGLDRSWILVRHEPQT